MPRSTLILLILLLTIVPSCFRTDEQRELRRREAQAFESETQVDEVGKAMHFLPLLLRLEQGSILRDFINQINSWAIAQPPHPSWKRSPLLDNLPKPLLDADFAQRLDRIEFGDLESEYLAQCKLMNEVSRWVTDRPYKDSLFAPWLAQQTAQLASEEALRLEQTMKLFDWTVRNIAVEGSAKEIEALIRDPLLPLSENGRGYRALPWQSMMFGRGDALQRTRVFTQLLFQLDIPAFILAIPDSEKGSTPDDRLLWCVGVPLAGEIYLFEMRLGLPFPSGDQPIVATLREARTNPNILRRAKVPGWFDYPMEAKLLENAVALLDVEPFALSHGMRALEERLTGEFRLRLAIDPQPVLETIHAIEPDLSVQLWQLPWFAQIYHRELRNRIDDLSPSSINYIAEFGAYLNESIVQEARMTHFRGQFETTVDSIGAPKKYMNIRIDEATLAKLPVETETQRQLQIVRRPNESHDEFQYRIRQAQHFYRSAKLDSNAFLGMLQFDLDNVDAAIDWLDNRLLQLDGAERWRAQAQYLLGRCCEARGEMTEALGWYKSEGSPQEAGNRIRVRLLEKMKAEKGSRENR